MADKEFEHAPNAKLDYGFDWTAWLASDETISTSTWDTGVLTSSSPQITGNKITSVFVEGGTVGTSYKIVNTITTSVGRIDSRTIRLSCKNR